MKTKLLLLLFFLFLLIVGTTNAMEIAVVHKGRSIPNIIVDVYEYKDTYREVKHIYLTDTTGRINTILPTDYYWIEIEVPKKDSSYDYFFNEEVYLKEDELNIIDCKLKENPPRTPGFELLTLLISIGIAIYILRKKK